MSNLLGKDEIITREESFTPGIIWFWIRIKFILTNKRITIYKPNLILGFIPLGMNELSQPLSDISLVRMSNKYHLLGFVAGLLGIYGSLKILQIGLPAFRFDSLDDWSFIFITLCWIFLMVLLILSSMQYSFVISNTAGQEVGMYTVSWLERSKLREFVNNVAVAKTDYSMNVTITNNKR